MIKYISIIQLLSCVQLFVTPWTAACQAPLSSTVSQGLLKLMSIESVMLSNHLFLCRPLLLLPLIFPSSVQMLSCFRIFVTPWTAARQASLPITNSWSLLKLMSIELVMPSNHIILCNPFLLPPSIFPSIGVFSNEIAFCIRWPKYWSFSISPSNEYSGLISFRIDWFDLLSVQGTLKSHLTAIPNKNMDQTWPPNLYFDYQNHYDFMKYQLVNNFRSWLIFHCFHIHTVVYLLLQTQR